MILLEIDRDGEVSPFDVKAFSPADIVDARNETMDEYRRNIDNVDDRLVGIALVTVEETQQVVVQLFKRDGRACHYIGPADHFVMDPPFDEEPAYDNYV